MEIQDGFIVGIFNYCDRWCEACRFTARCRVFADVAQLEAGQDPGFEELTELHERDEERRAVPEGIQTIVEEAEAAVERGEIDIEPQTPALAHARLTARAHDYMCSVLDWQRARAGVTARDPSDPVAIVSHYMFFIGAKIYRAITGLASEDEPDYPADRDGSAKAALLAMERSRDAWQQLLEAGVVSADQGRRWLEDLTWLIAAIERVFPRARAFVRPGFDEADAVAALDASER